MSTDDRFLDPNPPQPLGLSDVQPSPLLLNIKDSSEIGPTVEFWENRLELPIGRITDETQAPGFFANWIKYRTARQVAVLCHLLSIPIGLSPQQRRKALIERNAELLPFVLAADFAMRKSMHATLDVASTCLSSKELDLASDDNNKCDTTALIFAILYRSWRELERVFHLDKLHKAGFARMRLAKSPRRPQRKLSEFLQSDELLSMLKRFDAEERDRHVSELLQVIELKDSQLVFIRRPNQKSHILADERVVHGFTPDQIVLDFRDEGARLNVASHGHAASFNIANRIASAFYGLPCEYENITEETYPAQISRFLRVVRDHEEHDFRLVEMLVQCSPLTGVPDLHLKNDDGLPIGAALAQLEQALHWTIDDLDRIPRFKILFAGKRLAMEIERVEDNAGPARMYVLRYRDQTLSLEERKTFEGRMEQEHGIKVVSTEKRGARSRNS